MILRGIAEKWVWFTAVTESRRLEHQFQYTMMSVVMSVFLSLGSFPTGISDGQQNQRVYNQQWQRVNCMYQYPILNLLDIPSWQGIESSHQTFFVGGTGWLYVSYLAGIHAHFYIISEVLSELTSPINVTNQTFIMRHRPVTPGWRLKNFSSYVYMYQTRP